MTDIFCGSNIPFLDTPALIHGLSVSFELIFLILFFKKDFLFCSNIFFLALMRYPCFWKFATKKLFFVRARFQEQHSSFPFHYWTVTEELSWGKAATYLFLLFVWAPPYPHPSIFFFVERSSESREEEEMWVRLKKKFSQSQHSTALNALFSSFLEATGVNQDKRECYVHCKLQISFY